MSGVCGHSMPTKDGLYVIFATTGYARQFIEAEFQRLHVAYKNLDGCFEGKPEESYIVHESDWSKVRPYTRNERAVLIVGDPERGDRPAWAADLNDPGLSPRWAGMLRMCTKKHAMSQDAWTLDLSTGYYWCVFEAEVREYPWQHYDIRGDASAASIGVPEVAYAA